MIRYVQGLSGNATAAAKNLTRVEAALERETSALRSGLHSVQQISAHLKGQVSCLKCHTHISHWLKSQESSLIQGLVEMAGFSVYEIVITISRRGSTKMHVLLEPICCAESRSLAGLSSCHLR